MGRRRHTPEQIITALREAEVALANGKTVGEVGREVGRQLGITEQTYYRVLGGSRSQHRYGASGSAIWRRRCPNCSGSRPGLSIGEA